MDINFPNDMMKNEKQKKRGDVGQVWVYRKNGNIDECVSLFRTIVNRWLLSATSIAFACLLTVSTHARASTDAHNHADHVWVHC